MSAVGAPNWTVRKRCILGNFSNKCCFLASFVVFLQHLLFFVKFQYFTSWSIGWTLSDGKISLSLKDIRFWSFGNNAIFEVQKLLCPVSGERVNGWSWEFLSNNVVIYSLKEHIMPSYTKKHKKLHETCIKKELKPPVVLKHIKQSCMLRNSRKKYITISTKGKCNTFW